MADRNNVPGEWFDVSVPLGEGMIVWPGDPPTHVERIAAIERGDPQNISAMSLCLHAGTHIDAPRHYFADGAAIDGLPLAAVIGPARVIAIEDASITARELAGHKIRRGERILFKTRNSERARSAQAFFEDYVSLDREGAGYLAGCGILAAGIDYLSIGAPNEDGDQVHRALLSAGVWIIEGLDLSAVDPGDYDLVCLPLSIPGSDGAPARAVLRRR
jgi:arylformamidase